MKSVMYLIQAKDKLPDMYNCLRKRNFLLLSYTTETPDTTIFAPNTTWAEGRNLLYEYVKYHDLIYDYYVFMDEDIVLFPTSQVSKYPFCNLRNACISLISQFLPLRQFSRVQDTGYKSLEASLESNFPIVTLIHSFFINKKTAHNGRNTQLPEGYRQHATGKKTWHLQTLPIFDAILTAVSRDAFFAGSVLPYTTKYDTRSWWTSQYIFYLKANYYYHNRILQNNCYHIHNSAHTQYPQSGFTKELQLEIYKNLCKKYGINEIKASECKKIPSSTYIELNTLVKSESFTTKVIKYVIDLVSICSFLLSALPRECVRKIRSNKVNTN